MVSYIAQLTQDDYNLLQNPGVKRADAFAGTDAGLKIAAAIAALPVGIGGVVDATGFPNPQNLTGFTIPPGVTVILGPIFHTLMPTGPSILVQSGGKLRGSGCNSPGQTTLKAGNGFNKDVVQCGTTNAGTWWHNGRVEQLRIDGNKANNVTGNGLSIYGVGETSLVEQLQAQNCPNAGLYVHGSQSGTGNIRNITTNGNGRYGTQVDAFTSGLTFMGIGGDANPVTFAVTGTSQGGGALTLIDLKSEGPTDVTVLLAGGNSPVNLVIQGGNTLSAAGQALVRMAADTSPDHRITFIGVVSSGPRLLVDDQRNQVQVPCDAVSYHQVVAYLQGTVRSL